VVPQSYQDTTFDGGEESPCRVRTPETVKAILAPTQEQTAAHPARWRSPITFVVLLPIPKKSTEFPAEGTAIEISKNPGSVLMRCDENGRNRSPSGGLCNLMHDDKAGFRGSGRESTRTQLWEQWELSKAHQANAFLAQSDISSINSNRRPWHYEATERSRCARGGRRSEQ